MILARFFFGDIGEGYLSIEGTFFLDLEYYEKISNFNKIKIRKSKSSGTHISHFVFYDLFAVILQILFLFACSFVDVPCSVFSQIGFQIPVWKTNSKTFWSFDVQYLQLSIHLIIRSWKFCNCRHPKFYIYKLKYSLDR